VRRTTIYVGVLKLHAVTAHLAKKCRKCWLSTKSVKITLFSTFVRHTGKSALLAKMCVQKLEELQAIYCKVYRAQQWIACSSSNFCTFAKFTKVQKVQHCADLHFAGEVNMRGPWGPSSSWAGSNGPGPPLHTFSNCVDLNKLLCSR